MHPYRPPTRRMPPQVYWRRRAAAATVVLLVGFGGARLAGVGDEAPDPDDELASLVDEDTTTTTTTVIPPPECTDGEVPARQDPESQWDVILVDKARTVGDRFGPKDLYVITHAGFADSDEMVRSFVIADLGAMRTAAEQNGTPFSVIAGYRSYAQQAELYDRRTQQLGEAVAPSRVARAGHSEHQLGTTIDVGPVGQSDVTQAWAVSPEAQWIATNAHLYGFILSYPAGAESRTCYDYEPWHLRYVGRQRAADIVASGLTLREYLYKLEVETLGPPPETTTTTSTTAAPAR
ncbi:MAG: D-alanyl-D-alanine carboxypeptidase family protein [Acidimicrobiia bacterium]